MMVTEWGAIEWRPSNLTGVCNWTRPSHLEGIVKAAGREGRGGLDEVVLLMLDVAGDGLQQLIIIMMMMMMMMKEMLINRALLLLLQLSLTGCLRLLRRLLLLAHVTCNLNVLSSRVRHLSWFCSLQPLLIVVSPAFVNCLLVIALNVAIA